jgi:hypothetical protein
MLNLSSSEVMGLSEGPAKAWRQIAGLEKEDIRWMILKRN